MTGRKPSLIGSVNGMIVGLVAITPSAGFVNGYGAIMIGVIASSIVYVAYNYLSRLRPFRDVDDTLGVIYTHGFAGFAGGLLVGIFADSHMAVYLNPDGTPWFSATGSWHLFKWQLFAGLWVIGFTAVATFIILKLVGLVIPLRMTRGGDGAGRHRRPRARGVPVGHPVARLHRRLGRPASEVPPRPTSPASE